MIGLRHSLQLEKTVFVHRSAKIIPDFTRLPGILWRLADFAHRTAPYHLASTSNPRAKTRSRRLLWQSRTTEICFKCHMHPEWIVSCLQTETSNREEIRTFPKMVAKSKKTNIHPQVLRALWDDQRNILVGVHWMFSADFCGENFICLKYI